MMKASKSVPTATTNGNENTPSVCRWLTIPYAGRIVVEGRARLPEGYKRPTEADGFDLTWREGRDGVWHFRGEGRGCVLDLGDIERLDWLGLRAAVRVDRVSYEAPSAMEEFEDLPSAHVEIEDGRPV